MRWLDGIINSMDMSEQTPLDSEGQGSLGCCSPWGIKKSDMPEWLNDNNNNNNKQYVSKFRKLTSGQRTGKSQFLFQS